MVKAKYLARAWCVLGALCATAVLAQDATNYPQRPIKLVVGYPAGNTTDAIARILANKLSISLRQPVVVENKPGQGGSMALASVAKAAPDGYTMMIAPTASLVINPHLYNSVGYDSMTDFAPVATVAEVPYMLAANINQPFNNYAEFLAYTRANAGKLNYSSVGNGTVSHLAMEELKFITGIDVTHVPYQGSVKSVSDLMGGQVAVTIDTVGTLLPRAKSKQLKILAAASPKSLIWAPEIETISSQGAPGYTASAWLGLVFPKHTPKAIVLRMEAEVMKLMDDPEVKERFNFVYVYTKPGTSEQFAKLIADDYKKWGRLIKKFGVTIQ